MDWHAYLRYPLRVYGLFLLLIVFGLYAFKQMPVALFPNATKPTIGVHIPYAQQTQSGFLTQYGKRIEADLYKIRTHQCQVDKVKGSYQRDHVNYDITFQWGDDGQACLKEVDQKLTPYLQNRDGHYVYLDSSSTGYYLGTFYSEEMDSESMYIELRNTLLPKLKQIPQVNDLHLTNPDEKTVVIELDPAKLAELGIAPSHLIGIIAQALKSEDSGEFVTSSTHLAIEFKGGAASWDQLKDIPIDIGESHIELSHLVKVKHERYNSNKMIFKLDGHNAVILYVTPKPGENIKAMSQAIREHIESVQKTAKINPAIAYKTIIDPGKIIEQAIVNVVNEIWLCALIAVIVLFIFLGSVSGTFTALIEIPTSIILSFILLKLTGVEINLISLGGLALSVGMNVDASIVVIDAIIKYLKDLPAKAPFEHIAARVVDAVKEVQIPLILATISSLLVFIPLYFTADLTFAILGDLALAVVYSHGISLFVALILVPTIRLHILKYHVASTKHSIVPLSKGLQALYNGYHDSLMWFLSKRWLQGCMALIIIAVMGSAMLFMVPTLNKEIIATPDTNILGGSLYFPSNAQIDITEENVDDLMRQLRSQHPNQIQSIFSNVHGAQAAFVAVLLPNKKEFKVVQETAQKLASDNLSVIANFFAYNPSELPIPYMPDWRWRFTGPKDKVMQHLEDMYFQLLDANIVSDIHTDYNFVSPQKVTLTLQPNQRLFNMLGHKGLSITPQDIALLLQLAGKDKKLAEIEVNEDSTDVFITLSKEYKNNLDALLSMPVMIGDEALPLRALVTITPSQSTELLKRHNGENIFRLQGWFTEAEKPNQAELLNRLDAFLQEYKQHNHQSMLDNGVSLFQEDAKEELTQTIYSLLTAAGISLLLIFVLLYLRFSSVVYVLIIMLAIPFGLLGVVCSLYWFNSTISVNSGLGVILLNGISVANSILLVELILIQHQQGIDALTAISNTVKKRIAPILMTTLTTVLGMLPIALGYGEGGSVLQPLGIAVCGGLWVSLLFTLYFVPACMYLALSKK